MTGRPSIPETPEFIRDACGILDAPLEAAHDRGGCASAFSPHIVRESLLEPPSRIRGRRECRVPAAPIASHANEKSIRVSHHRYAETCRHSLRDGFNGYFVLSSVTGLFCHRRHADSSAKLDTSVGASGPHDFAVR